MLNSVENLILTSKMIDFKPKKGRFTWTNNRVGAANIFARLDRFLVHSSLLKGKKIIASNILAKLTSDHKPIVLLIEDEEDLGPIPFQFNPLWKDQESFMSIVSLAWDILVV